EKALKKEEEKTEVLEEEPEEEETGLEVAPSHELTTTVPVSAHPKEEQVQPTLRVSFEEAVATALTAAAPTLKKKKIPEKAFADLAAKAIRGVRDVYQTRDKIEKDFKLSPKELTALIDAVK